MNGYPIAICFLSCNFLKRCFHFYILTPRVSARRSFLKVAMKCFVRNLVVARYIPARDFCNESDQQQRGEGLTHKILQRRTIYHIFSDVRWRWKIFIVRHFTTNLCKMQAPDLFVSNNDSLVTKARSPNFHKAKKIQNCGKLSGGQGGISML